MKIPFSREDVVRFLARLRTGPIRGPAVEMPLGASIEEVEEIRGIIPNRTLAFTIGRTKNYDRSLAEGEADGVPTRKVGRIRDDGEPYIVGGEEYWGGIAWQSPLEAARYITSPAWREAFPDDDPDSFSVYQLQVPNSWEADTYERGGQRYLERDALIVRRVENEPGVIRAPADLSPEKLEEFRREFAAGSPDYVILTGAAQFHPKEEDEADHHTTTEEGEPHAD